MTAGLRARRQELGRLLRSSEPSIRWRARVRVLGEERGDRAVRRLEEEIRSSRRVRLLLAERNPPNQQRAIRNVYHYWQGIHWTLGSLVDIGFPARDPRVVPWLDQALEQWTRPRYRRLLSEAESRTATGETGVRVIEGRPRRCASIQGLALLYACRLGAASDERTRLIAKILQRWQWPDGGWNCDRTPSADTSSFMETLLTMRGLAAYGRLGADRQAARSARRATEVFLSRRMFRRRSDGRVIRPEFRKLHYPVYWHYDILAGLKGMMEAGVLRDARCAEGLDWLESRELASGGWPADRASYRTSPSFRTGCEYVSWGPVDAQTRNPWVTTDALAVLAAADRFAA